MPKFCRSVLKCSVVLGVYCLVIGLWFYPVARFVVVALLLGRVYQRRKQYDTHGSARLADISDVTHMLEGNGIPIGYMAGCQPVWESVKAVFNRRLSDKNACAIATAGARGPPRLLLRLHDPVHR